MEEVKKKDEEEKTLKKKLGCRGFIQLSLHPDPDPWLIHLNRLLEGTQLPCRCMQLRLVCM